MTQVNLNTNQHAGKHLTYEESIQTGDYKDLDHSRDTHASNSESNNTPRKILIDQAAHNFFNKSCN